MNPPDGSVVLNYNIKRDYQQPKQLGCAVRRVNDSARHRIRQL